MLLLLLLLKLLMQRGVCCWAITAAGRCRRAAGLCCSMAPPRPGAAAIADLSSLKHNVLFAVCIGDEDCWRLSRQRVQLRSVCGDEQHGAVATAARGENTQGRAREATGTMVVMMVKFWQQLRLQGGQIVKN